MVLRVLAGVPVTVPSFYAEYRTQVLSGIEAALRGCSVEYDVCISPKTEKQGSEGIVEATNYLAEKCVSEDYDFLWIVEADVQVPEHAFDKLLCFSADINLGIYPNHRNKLHMMAGYFKEKPNVLKPLVHTVSDVEQLRGKVFETMVWAGIGCALISRRVLEKLRFVWDKYEFERFVGVHDQLFLFQAQQQFGFRVFLHGDVLCGHFPEWSLQKLEEAISGR
jgi:hypothetical protein